MFDYTKSTNIFNRMSFRKIWIHGLSEHMHEYLFIDFVYCLDNIMWSIFYSIDQSNGIMWHPSSPRPEKGLGRSDSVWFSHFVSSSKSVFSCSSFWLRNTTSCMVRPSPATSGTSFAKARSRLWFSAFTDPNTATRSPTFMPDSSAGDSLAIPLIFAKGRRRGASALPDPFIDEFGRLLLLLFSVATLVDVAWVLSVLLELSRFCDRFSKERLSPPATPETDPSQFITTHFPVTGSYFGRGFGARRRAFSSASSFFFGGFCYQNSVRDTKARQKSKSWDWFTVMANNGNLYIAYSFPVVCIVSHLLWSLREAEADPQFFPRFPCGQSWEQRTGCAGSLLGIRRYRLLDIPRDQPEECRFPLVRPLPKEDSSILRKLHRPRAP